MSPSSVVWQFCPNRPPLLQLLQSPRTASAVSSSDQSQAFITLHAYPETHFRALGQCSKLVSGSRPTSSGPQTPEQTFFSFLSFGKPPFSVTPSLLCRPWARLLGNRESATTSISTRPRFCQLCARHLIDTPGVQSGSAVISLSLAEHTSPTPDRQVTLGFPRWRSSKRNHPSSISTPPPPPSCRVYLSSPTDFSDDNLPHSILAARSVPTRPSSPATAHLDSVGA
ncbi:hypothetical protein VTJ04DRAFT_3751 [Mycothermus thermophilus]|uniref:uncharacterized protein n=1 Tax=Humicola insolens TaxID=85995 RepID=UPI0037447D82